MFILLKLEMIEIFIILLHTCSTKFGSTSCNGNIKMESIKASKCLLYLKTSFELLKILLFCCLEQAKNHFETLMNVAGPTPQFKEQSGEPGFFPISSNHLLD